MEIVACEVFPLFKDGGGVSGCCNNLIFDIFINQLYKYIVLS
jgi:hypothetical protein